MPNVIVTATYNPPTFTIVGSPIREETVKRMEQRIPSLLSTALSQSREPARFTLRDNSKTWCMELNQHFCDELHRSAVSLVIIEALDGEGWTLRTASASHDSKLDRDVIKLFFSRSG
ncbi:hypothetical protein TRVL_00631 [Trypanosoma vivax]|nr:hypothetical protein TRVL_00631 [Trypanosoma vivax]